MSRTISAGNALLVRRPPIVLIAVGDVRHGSVKRVASAVGEGAIAVQLVHEYPAEQAS